MRTVASPSRLTIGAIPRSNSSPFARTTTSDGSDSGRSRMSVGKFPRFSISGWSLWFGMIGLLLVSSRIGVFTIGCRWPQFAPVGQDIDLCGDVLGVVFHPAEQR